MLLKEVTWLIKTTSNKRKKSNSEKLIMICQYQICMGFGHTNLKLKEQGKRCILHFTKAFIH